MLYNPDCDLCQISESSRHRCIYGQGGINPKVMFIIEAPGETEDKTGRTFSGRERKALDLITQNCGLEEDEVYITNAVKCRPYNDRKPKQSEIKNCKRYLEDEVKRINPKVIVTLGATPLRAVLGLSGIDKVRRRQFESFDGVPTFATYHPSIAYYKGPSFINEIYDDVMFALGELEEESIDFTFLDEEPDFEDWFTPMMCLDIETNDSTDPFVPGSTITEVGVVNERNEVYHITGVKRVIRFVDRYMEYAVKHNTLTVGHNIKSDFRHLRYHGANQKLFIKLRIFDTLVAMSHIDENYPNKSLEHLSQVWLGVPAWKHLWDVDRTKYNCYDVVNNLALAKVFIKELNKQDLSYIFMQDMETEKALVEIELNGMKANEAALRVLKKIYNKELVRIARLIPIRNPSSAQQVATYIYKTLELPIPEAAYLDDNKQLKESIKNAKAEGKNWHKWLGTSQEIMLEIMREIDDETHKRLLANLIRYRSLSTIFSTFIKGWLDKIREDGCLHTTYALAKSQFGDKGSEGGAVTGRLGSKDPNLMNIPREKVSEEEELEENLKKYGIKFLMEAIPKAWNVKQCITSRFEGGEILQADADQAEMRGAANFSDDKVMIQIFLDGIDIHLGTAAAVENLPLDKVSKVQRKGAKTCNFGVVYGSSIGTMALKMGVTFEWMKNFIEKFKKRFSTFWTWKEAEEEKILKQGYARNVFGRVRHLPGVSRHTGSGRAKLREGINFLVQGPVAELTKYFMTKLTFKFIKLGLKSLVIGNIHDAVVVDIHPDERATVIEIVKELGHRSHPLLRKYPVPFIFTIDIGPNLMDTTELEEAA